MGDEIFTTTTSVVLNLVPPAPGPPVLVGKFTNNCYSNHASRKTGTDVWTREFEFLSILNNTGLTPDVFALTEEFPVGSPAIRQSNSTFVHNHPNACESASVRGIIQAKVGAVVEQGISLASPNFVPDSIRAGIKTLALVQKLHALGVVHGDIHFGNVAFAQLDETNVETDPLVLIDFYLAVSRETGGPRRVPKTSFLNLAILSPWHLRNERISMRDDVYRVVQSVAYMLTQAGIAEFTSKRFDAIRQKVLSAYGYDEAMFKSLETQVQTLLIAEMEEKYAKAKEKMPLIRGVPGPLARFGPKIRNAIKRVFNRQLPALMRQWNSPDTVPDYEVVGEIFEKLLAVFPRT